MLAKALFAMAKNNTGLPGLLQPLEQATEFQGIINGLNNGLDQQHIFGLAGPERTLIIAGIIYQKNGPALIITPNESDAGTLLEDLSYLLPDREVMLFPVWQAMPFPVVSHNREINAQRLRVLEKLISGQNPVVVAPVEAVLRRLAPPAVYHDERRILKVGQRVDLEDLQQFLVRQGYERVDMIEGPGQFSIRGGILDVYPPAEDNPLRVEFWDDEVDSIRTFEISSQRSIENLSEVKITPAQEMAVSEKYWADGRERLLNEYRNHHKKMVKSASVDAQHQLNAQVESLLARMEKPAYFEGAEKLLPYFYPELYNIVDYFPADTPLLIEEPLRIKEIIEVIQKERAETHTDLLAKGKTLPSQYHIYLDWRQFWAKLERRQSLFFSFLPRSAQFLKPKNIVNFIAKAMHPFLGNLAVLADEVKQWKRKKYAVVLMVSTAERARSLLETLKEAQIDAFYMSKLSKEVLPGNIVITEGYISAGFELTAARLAVITEKEIFGQRKKKRKRREFSENKVIPIEELKPNDYVVHINHGIGRYLGLTTLDIGGIQKDYLIIQYAGEDKIYVPTDQVDLLQRYSGNEGIAPKLSKMGGSEWKRTKNKVRAAVKQIADDLLQLYAKRQAQKGYAFSKDTVWQREFESAFPYEETPDQLKAIAEVKKDMESPRPMDRLLCGDVGYGKTEVALRAAFKAVNDGKQVAVLVPTTILAQQHYNTFRERFAPYPVNIEMLSRFRTPKEQRAVLQGLSDGSVDIVIGTHRLVQKDVKFKDLGLVVIDEEQRFGVAHKERLKQLRATVDVLTLTATPIPRTLHMSLVKVRDTSLLETPPEERYPVQTYVMEEDPVMIREAIRREINRGGQVFFVHNRVAELDVVANWLSGLVPEAKLVVAHGQMKEEQLEKIMLDFMAGSYDVLVCTTIIETGLDLPNVNTLIVKDADRFGLAQLYQLRGRVGRSNRVAYAYFTFRKDKVLTEEAERRLSAIRDFTDLGSGYKIAMRDLEIRGAGNILGVEQHGHIAEVGFDLYCRMLEEAVREAKGEEIEKTVDTVIELPVDAYIPENYISDSGQKVELYRRIANMKEPEQVDDLEEELVDRFGDVPAPVQRLLLVAKLKAVGSKLKIKSISRQSGYIKFVFGSEPPLNAKKLVELSERYRKCLKFNNSAEEFEIKIKFRQVDRIDCQQLKELLDFTIQLAAKDNNVKN